MKDGAAACKWLIMRAVRLNSVRAAVRIARALKGPDGEIGRRSGLKIGLSSSSIVIIH
jgi:hypothetical protein